MRDFGYKHLYLEKAAMVPKGKIFNADSDTGFTRAIDLGRALAQEISAGKSV
jgi:hypothetical protein